MLYKPSELAQELGMPTRIIREGTQKGLPCTRDTRGHIWIDGREMQTWVQALRSRQPQKMLTDEAYCFHCRKPVKLQSPTQVNQDKRILLRGECSHCGKSICRGGRNDQSSKSFLG